LIFVYRCDPKLHNDIVQFMLLRIDEQHFTENSYDVIVSSK